MVSSSEIIPTPQDATQQEDGSYRCNTCHGDWYACDCPRYSDVKKMRTLTEQIHYDFHVKKMTVQALCEKHHLTQDRVRLELGRAWNEMLASGYYVEHHITLRQVGVDRKTTICVLAPEHMSQKDVYSNWRDLPAKEATL